MSHYRTTQLKGTRYYKKEWGLQPVCPHAYNCMQYAGSLLNKALFTTELLGNKASGFDEEDALASSSWALAGTSEYLLTGTTEPPTMTTGFKIKKQKMYMDLRNNYDHIADICVYVIKPRTLIPDLILDVNPSAYTTINNVLVDAILQGVYNKLDASALGHAQTNWPMQRAVPTQNHGCTGVVEHQLLHKRYYTPFDSEQFVRLFSVKDVYKFRLKPNDTAFVEIDGPSVEFLDGYDLYSGAETLGNDSETLVYIDIKGVVGHTTNAFPTIQTKHATSPLSAVAADMDVIGMDKAAVDVICHVEYEIEIFDTQLQAPAIGSNVYSDDAGNMGTAITSTAFT